MTSEPTHRQPPSSPHAEAAAPANRGVSLGDRTAGGFLWTMVQTMGGKAMRFATHLILGLILMPESFGLFATAASITAFAALVQDAGVRDILIQRQRNFDRWATAGFWLSLFMGVTIGVVVAAAATPLARYWFQKPEVAGLLIVASANFPISALASVPLAKLNAELRFRTIAMITFTETVALSILTVLFAVITTSSETLAPYAAYSFVLPWPITSALRVGLLWRKAPVRIAPRLHLRRWKHIIGDSFYVIAGSFGGVLLVQSPFLIMGRLMHEREVGYYYFAYRLAAQGIALFGANLRKILFPALSQLQHDPGRQLSSFFRALQLLAFLSLPMCFLQAASIRPLLRVLWDDAWLDSAFTAEVLTIGTAFTMLSFSASSLIQAQGRFGLRFVVAWSGAIAITIGSFIAAVAGTYETIAVVVACFTVAYAAANLALAVRGGAGRPSAILPAIAPPLILSTAAIAPAWALAHAVPALESLRLRAALQLATVNVVGVLVYALIFRLFAPRAYRDLKERLLRLLSRRRRRRQARQTAESGIDDGSFQQSG